MQITATEGITIDGEDSSGIGSVIGSELFPRAVGGSDGIVIDTTTLDLSNGGHINTTTDSIKAGSITITATEGITIDGVRSNGIPSGIFSQVNREADGNGGQIFINTSTLSLTNGGQISASTFGKGDAGEVQITASDSVSISGTVFNETLNREIGGVLAFTLTAGKAGDITINTPQLTISEGAGIEAFTQGEGKAGNITINATESLILNNDTRLIVESSNVGTAGNITITTPLLTIGENAQLSATATETSTSPTAGDINLNVNQLNISGRLGIFAETQSIADAGSLTIQPYQTNSNLNIQFTDEGFISARTTDIGKGGSINITAPENIDIRGNGSITAQTSGSGQAGNINIDTQRLTIADGVIITSSTEANSTGNGGNITINSPLINLENNAAIAVSSQGEGIGGDINITANFLNLDNSEITAQTLSTDGGNINLQILEGLILNNSSNITATAGTDQAGGDGGNIKINSPFIISIPSNPFNTITANAFEGEGGKIEITTNAIFGGEFLIIDASSQLGLDGEVIINDPDVDPTSGLIIIDANFIDAEGLIAQNPCAVENFQIAGGSSFVVIGKGKLPTQSADLLNNNLILTPWFELTPEVPLDSTFLEGEVNLSAEKEKKSLFSAIYCREKN